MSVTVGGDSYVSLADCDAVFAAREVAAWAAATVAARAGALRAATAWIDGNHRFPGWLQHPDQTLAWPRAGATDAEGRELTGIPDRLAEACRELALIALAGGLAPGERPAGRVVAERIGPLSIRYADDGRPAADWPLVDALLSGLVLPPPASALVGRS